MALPLLEEFVCTDCALTKLPSSMLKWERLVKIEVNNNSIVTLFDEETEAKIVSETIGWPKLKTAFLGSNQLEAFPEIILNSPKLKDLRISSNKITCIPASIKNLTQLKLI
jgi:Leucine-rich repeat (LRR) protein